MGRQRRSRRADGGLRPGPRDASASSSARTSRSLSARGREGTAQSYITPTARSACWCMCRLQYGTSVPARNEDFVAIAKDWRCSCREPDRPEGVRRGRPGRRQRTPRPCVRGSRPQTSRRTSGQDRPRARSASGSDDRSAAAPEALTPTSTRRRPSGSARRALSAKNGENVVIPPLRSVHGGGLAVASPMTDAKRPRVPSASCSSSRRGGRRPRYGSRSGADQTGAEQVARVQQRGVEGGEVVGAGTSTADGGRGGRHDRGHRRLHGNGGDGWLNADGSRTRREKAGVITRVQAAITISEVAEP